MSPLKLSILQKICMGMFEDKNFENFQKESKINENDLPVGLDSLITVIMGDVSVPPVLLAVQRYLPSFCTVNEYLDEIYFQSSLLCSLQKSNLQMNHLKVTGRWLYILFSLQFRTENPFFKIIACSLISILGATTKKKHRGKTNFPHHCWI